VTYWRIFGFQTHPVSLTIRTSEDNEVDPQTLHRGSIVSEESVSRPGNGGSLTSRVQAAIENMIMNGELRGGDRVNEIALSEKFGTSRGPLREACRALTQEGLLVAIPNRGVFVRELGLREALEVYDIRSALDELMGRLIAERVNDEQIARLSDLIGTMDSAAAERDLERYYPANLEFHNLLLAYANNRRLERLYQGLIKELHLFRRKGLLQSGSMRISNEEHRQIVEALAARDPIAAGVTMKSHVLAAKHRLLAAVEAERSQEVSRRLQSARRQRQEV
jgi:DNA-binding GntR family transcriptional regulator